MSICTFEMRVRGTEENCKKFLSSGTGINWCIVKKAEGTCKDFMYHIKGECYWNVACSMIYYLDEGGLLKYSDTSIVDLSKRLNLEIEVFGYDLDDIESWLEHYYFKNGEFIGGGHYPRVVSICDDGDMEEFFDKYVGKYYYIEGYDIYVLKDIISDKVQVIAGEVVCDFTMSFGKMRLGL